MNSFHSAEYFLIYINNSITNKTSKDFLTVAHIIIHNDSNNSDIHRSFKYCIQNFKTSVKIMNIRYQHIVYLEENKFRGSKKGPQYCIISFCLKDIPTFSELIIKNTRVKK